MSYKFRGHGGLSRGAGTVLYKRRQSHLYTLKMVMILLICEFTNVMVNMLLICGIVTFMNKHKNGSNFI